MKKSNIITLSLMAITIGVIVIATSKKVYDTHRANSFKVVEQRIEEAAKKCILDEQCTDETTISDLIKKKYLSKQVHPVTKEYINENLVVTCQNYLCNIDIK